MVPLLLEDGGLAGGSAAHCGPLTLPPTTATTPIPGGIDIYGPTFVYRIPVVFHVVHNGAGEHPGGMLAISRVTTQIARLNADFAPMQIEFYLNTAVDGDGIMYHNNAVWFTTTTDAWSASTVDGHNNLNIFSYDMAGGLAGRANIPQGCGPSCVPVGHPSDVVELDYLFVGDPSQLVPPYHQGRIATHEVGHYLGLYHVFEGNCSSDTAPGCYQTGDAICDTSQQNGQPAGGTCVAANSCAGGGLDPMNNYMNYSDPTCQNAFTAEQMRRARCSLEHWRPNLFELTGCAAVPSFPGNFTGTPHVVFSHVAKPGTTIFVPGPSCPPGLSDGSGEGGNVYAGSPNSHTGNEIGFRILHGGGDLRVDLTGLATDLDLFLLGAAGTPASTLQRSENGGNTSESVFIAGAAPGTYYAVVDTFAASGSAFSLTYRGTPVGYNLDINTAGGANPGFGVPAAAFAGAAAQAGTWTALTGTSTNVNLAVASGFVTSASITRSTGANDFTTNNANTSGDYQLLFDDIQDVPAAGATYTFANLPAGKYRVFTYAIAPDSATVQTNIAVTGSPDPITAVGGPMPVNGFVLNDTHASHRVNVAPGGAIVVTASQFGGDVLSVNGFQIKPRPACPADVNGSDGVDVNDLLAVITTWGACPLPCPPNCAADISPNCQVDVNDLLSVISTWGPCPG